ncbi:MAG: hypothetical protein IJ158_04055 [Treponema sp.]|nr:hypothetical protein [Treponema sp.]
MILSIINIIALILIPIVSVLLGHYLQDRSKKREDKLAIFKSLMTSRIYWTVDSVHALNLIDIVFSDDVKVIEQWRILHDKLFVENPTDTELHKIKIEKDKLLEIMAKSLGYKMDLEIIQNPYIPNGLVDLLNNQQAFSNMQLEIMKKMNGSLSLDTRN